MKKSIWIVLPIIIIAIVLVAVFAGQRNTLSTQIAQLEADKADLNKQLSEAAADTAAKLPKASPLKRRTRSKKWPPSWTP